MRPDERDCPTAHGSAWIRPRCRPPACARAARCARPSSAVRRDAGRRADRAVRAATPRPIRAAPPPAAPRARAASPPSSSGAGPPRRRGRRLPDLRSRRLRRRRQRLPRPPVQAIVAHPRQRSPRPPLPRRRSRAPAATTPLPAGPIRCRRAPPPVAQAAAVNPFLSQDPALKARRLARALVSDMVVYHPAKRRDGLRAATLKESFKEEITEELGGVRGAGGPRTRRLDTRTSGKR